MKKIILILLSLSSLFILSSCDSEEAKRAKMPNLSGTTFPGLKDTTWNYIDENGVEQNPYSLKSSEFFIDFQIKQDFEGQIPLFSGYITNPEGGVWKHYVLYLDSKSDNDKESSYSGITDETDLRYDNAQRSLNRDYSLIWAYNCGTGSEHGEVINYTREELFANDGNHVLRVTQAGPVAGNYSDGTPISEGDYVIFDNQVRREGEYKVLNSTPYEDDDTHGLFNPSSATPSEIHIGSLPEGLHNNYTTNSTTGTWQLAVNRPMDNLITDNIDSYIKVYEMRFSNADLNPPTVELTSDKATKMSVGNQYKELLNEDLFKVSDDTSTEREISYSLDFDFVGYMKDGNTDKDDLKLNSDDEYNVPVFVGNTIGGYTYTQDDSASTLPLNDLLKDGDSYSYSKILENPFFENNSDYKYVVKVTDGTGNSEYIVLDVQVRGSLWWVWLIVGLVVAGGGTAAYYFVFKAPKKQ